MCSVHGHDDLWGCLEASEELAYLCEVYSYRNTSIPLLSFFPLLSLIPSKFRSFENPLVIWIQGNVCLAILYNFADTRQ